MIKQRDAARWRGRRVQRYHVQRKRERMRRERRMEEQGGEGDRETKKKMHVRERGEKWRQSRDECATEILSRAREKERKRGGEGEEGGDTEMEGSEFLFA